MPNIRRIIPKTAQYLRRRVQTLEASLVNSDLGVTRKETFDGYLITVRKSPDGTVAHLLELPAFLCIQGRFIFNGTFDPDSAYLQSLLHGRDSYWPGDLTQVLDPQFNPLLLAGPYKELSLGPIAVTDNRAPTRFWGVGQPFAGVGCVYGFGAVYLSNTSPRWSLTWAKLADSFVYRFIVMAPTTVRYIFSTTQLATIPENPTALPTTWTFELSESVLAGIGAVAFTRYEGADIVDNTEADWETAQYPWFTFAQPKTFTSDDGTKGFKVMVCALVVYDYGGPYPQPLPNNTNGWGETDFGSPAGGRGLWVAEVQVLKGAVSILHQYKVYGGETRRTPLLIDHRGQPVAFAQRWYADNVVYKTTPVQLDTGQTVLVSVTYVDRTPQIIGEPVQDYDAYLFLDVMWFQDGAQRLQNISSTKLTRDVFVPSSEGEVRGQWIGHLTAFDAGLNEGRFAIGAATDGKIVVMPVFSCFRPGDSPRLQILVADKDGATIGYDGVPGFAMCMALGIDEQVDIQHVEHPTDGGGGTGNPIRFWTLPAGTDQVGYIGNNRFAFFVSTEWTTPGEADTFAPAGNSALAVYDATTGHVSVAGVIDPTIGDTGLTGTFAILAVLTQTYFSARLGRIEVVRPESDGYIPAGGSQAQVGHPATLIVTSGRGPAGLSLPSEDGFDIQEGATTISYDSGKTWTVFLQYGSPSGVFHCGNVVQARTEPVVRV